MAPDPKIQPLETIEKKLYLESAFSTRATEFRYMPGERKIIALVADASKKFVHQIGDCDVYLKKNVPGVGVSSLAESEESFMSKPKQKVLKVVKKATPIQSKILYKNLPLSVEM